MASLTIQASIDRILIGGSAGSFNQIITLLEGLPPETGPPVVLLLHMGAKDKNNKLCEVMSKMLTLSCHTARHGMHLEAGKLYVPCPDYHLLVNPHDNTLRLYDDDPYSFAKPSIDLLFSSCAGPEARHTMAILLSGANDDGAQGLASLYAEGATCAVADPELCQFPAMPLAALKREPELIRLNPLCLNA